jgi:glycosyltransferase involved in cell wall biosynthesis
MLLTSLRASSFKNFEVIVGDDASRTEKPTVLLKQMKKKIGKKYPRFVRLTLNQGPAAARNAAARLAKGKIIVFLDADVSVYPETLKRIAMKFTNDPDLTALTGVWDKDQKTQAFFPQFKALRDWSYWTNERDRNGYYYLFSTRIAAIKRQVFRRLDGFNEAFREMEDVEITYRIARRYAIIFAPDVRVHHEFEGFWPIARKYFWRSFYWMRLYKERQKFDPVATTMKEAITTLTGAAVVATSLVAVFMFLFMPVASAYTLYITMGFLGIHIFSTQKFLLFVYREKGIVFAGKSLGMGLILCCFISAGALASRLVSRNP